MKTKNKILFIIPSLSIGGTNTALISLLNNIKLDCDVFAMTHQGNCTFGTHLISENRLLSAYYSNFQEEKTFFILLIKILKRLCSWLHINFEKYLLKNISHKIQAQHNYKLIIAFQEGDATKFAAQFTGRKIAWIHCNYDYYILKKSSEESIYQQYDNIVCVSEYTKKIFQERYPSISEKVLSIHNLLDIEYIKKKSIVNQPLNKQVFTIVSIGRIHPIKRFTQIPTIAMQLKEKGDNFIWYIIGPPTDSEEYKKLKNSILHYNVQNIVVLTGEKENPYPYIANCNLLVCLSESEACPMIFNEAKILHTPIISTNFGSASEFITNGINGYITSLNNVTNIIDNLIKDSKKYKIIKGSCYKTKYSNYTIVEDIRRLLSNYE